MQRQQQPALNIESVVLPPNALHTRGQAEARITAVKLLPVANCADLDLKAPV